MSRSMDNETRRGLPIAVFDSGMGGVSVLRELKALMPEERYLYYGDSANAPYGTKTVEQVRTLTLERIGALHTRGIKAAVIACNTATSAAVNELRERFADIPVIGMEPAVKPAVLAHPNSTVLVLATPLTLREKKFRSLLAHYASLAEIVPLPCPELVEFVERGELDSSAVYDYLERMLGVYRGKAAAAVLGCTHFPFVRRAIQTVLGPDAKLYDGGAGTARETRRQLKIRDMLSVSGQNDEIVIENSRENPQEIALTNMLLQAKL